MTPTHLLYLHGFRSSPRSFKAQRLQAWLAANRPEVHWWCPQLPPSPQAVMALVHAGIAGWPADRSAVVGSSLGGFYATVVGQAQGWPTVLINPAVDPARDLAAYIGEQTAFHNPEEKFLFEPAFVDDLFDRGDRVREGREIGRASRARRPCDSEQVTRGARPLPQGHALAATIR